MKNKQSVLPGTVLPQSDLGLVRKTALKIPAVPILLTRSDRKADLRDGLGRAQEAREGMKRIDSKREVVPLDGGRHPGGPHRDGDPLVVIELIAVIVVLPVGGHLSIGEEAGLRMVRGLEIGESVHLPEKIPGPGANFHQNAVSFQDHIRDHVHQMLLKRQTMKPRKH